MQSARRPCLVRASPRFLVLLCFCLFLLVGCNQFVEQKPPSLSGTFRGATADGRVVTVTLTQKKNSLTGAGYLGDRPFSFAGLPSWHGPLVINFPQGPSARGSFMLSTDGKTMSLGVLGATFTLTRGGEPVGAATGPFAGRFGVTDPKPLWVNLTQADNLLAGTGFHDGKPVAFVGRVVAPLQAKGTLLFPDKSQLQVTLKLSESRHMLTVLGLGGRVDLPKR